APRNADGDRQVQGRRRSRPDLDARDQSGQRGLSRGSRSARRGRHPPKRRDGQEAQVPAPRPHRSDDAQGRVGLALVSGQARLDAVGRTKLLRCLHNVRGHGARRHQISRLVTSMMSIRQFSRSRIRQLSRGFTMIELLVVLALIVILASMGMAQYRASVVHAKEAVLKTDLAKFRDAIDQYYADKNQWPSTLDALVSEGYLRKLPEDPFTKSASTWQTVPADPDPTNPSAEVGVYDVKSGSEATALDGTKYADWD